MVLVHMGIDWICIARAVTGCLALVLIALRSWILCTHTLVSGLLNDGIE
jgi:hypothetical protein